MSDASNPPSSGNRSYVLITPCRDEAAYARRCIASVVQQTVLPALWIIVDDGSTDETPAILAEAAARHPWIKIVRREDRGKRAVGPGVVDAFYAGWNEIKPADFEYSCKFDLDLDIPPRYFETLIERMEADPLLGTCSGKPYFEEAGQLVSEKCGDEMSVGMTKFYRVSCFQQIGGFVREVMWDGIDCHRCRMLGWKASSWDAPDLRFIHLRPMGSSQQNILVGRQRHGFGQYFMGTSLVYITISAVFRMFHPPYLIGGLAIWWGYVKSALERKPRYNDLAFRKFLRKYQWDCLCKGKKKATQTLHDSLKQSVQLAILSFGMLLLLGSTGCSAPPKAAVYAPPKLGKPYAPVKGLKPGEFFKAELDASSKDFATGKKVTIESAKLDGRYRFGPGDRFAFLVQGRENISREEIIIGPDGEVALPQVGIVQIKGLTLKDATDLLTKKLSEHYDNPVVTLVMKTYANNRVFVLGRVANPGAITFQGPGTLLEALSLAGGLPADQAKSFLSRCMIVRGNNLVMWIDLKELLERGNMALNAGLQNGDVIFIPQSEDQLAYVLGEVKTPGVVALRSELTLLDAVLGSGGPTKNANIRSVYLVRQVEGRGVVQKVNLQELVSRADFRANYVLQDGDLIYIPDNALGKINYVASQLAPALTVVGIATNGILGSLGGLLFGTNQE